MSSYGVIKYDIYQIAQRAVIYNVHEQPIEQPAVHGLLFGA